MTETFTKKLIEEIDQAASQDDWDAMEKELDEIERQSEEDFAGVEEELDSFEEEH